MVTPRQLGCDPGLLSGDRHFGGTAPCANLGPGGEEHLDRCVGKDHGADVPPLDHRRTAVVGHPGTLPIDHETPHLGVADTRLLLR